MNALYNHALKQKSQLTSDLAKFENNLMTSPISLQGSISATLVSFEKTINQYNDFLSKNKELEDNEKYSNRLDQLREELNNFSTKFKDLKKNYNELNNDKMRKNLFGTTSSENPFDEDTTISNRRRHQQNDANDLNMFDGLQKENSIFNRGNSQLDYILEMGQNSLNDIIEQNHILEKVQDTLTKSLRTLNVSEDTIQLINRRAFHDKLIFWFALFCLFLGIYFIIKFLR
ncbi:hypothetical protein KAFR_0D00830 [Kazachstania africana CBS 2517]|uniref:Protein transport protein BOS1 n=1 Tax=Kazachstania africana (strain ATCC 22294 / BCRC 22015 / CBS 2517 / CECT 1963 / NBRC 1671 / NRRL Y-8276) TaxID=1071382 RepID=H2ATN0_KAZAF|nr:hypothetical protein KAFR_0D00830 [Kazachstania africana CBS 2517]CCF57730.1 hypothetical protein KAFR_0D00830 [Kazachstania africana CBS 2517]